MQTLWNKFKFQTKRKRYYKDNIKRNPKISRIFEVFTRSFINLKQGNLEKFRNIENLAYLYKNEISCLW